MNNVHPSTLNSIHPGTHSTHFTMVTLPEQWKHSSVQTSILYHVVESCVPDWYLIQRSLYSNYTRWTVPWSSKEGYLKE